MAQTPSDVHVNRPLTNMMINWALRFQQLAWNTVFPTVGVKKQSDRYFVYSRKDIQRDNATKRAPGTKVPRQVRRLSDDSYLCERHSYAEAIDDPTRANADEPLQLDRGAAQTVGQKLMLRLERIFAARVFADNVWKGSTKAGGVDLDGSTADFAQFGAPTTGNPITEALRPQILHMTKLGIANSELTLTIAPDVMAVFLDHEQFLNRLSDNEMRKLSSDRIAQILEVGRVIVPTVGFVDEDEDEPAADNAPNENKFVVEDQMLLTYTPSAPSIMQPSAGYSFQWNGLFGSREGMRTKRYREEDIESDIVEGDATIDPKITAPELGIRWKNCLAPAP